jgi:EF hand
MWRYIVGGSATLLLIVAGFFIWQGIAQREDSAAIPEAPEQAEADDDEAEESGPAPRTPPSADERTREQRRFDRADRDNDGRITLEEQYHPRRRAYQRLDTNRDGHLSFEEWAVRTRTRFAQADRDRNASLSREEYATTAQRRRPQRRAANCRC